MQFGFAAWCDNADFLATPEKDAVGHERRFYFEDLDPELQKVLRAQLRKGGDLSAVIEMPRGFCLYLARDVTHEKLSVLVLLKPKRSYEEWLAAQTR